VHCLKPLSVPEHTIQTRLVPTLTDALKARADRRRPCARLAKIPRAKRVLAGGGRKKPLDRTDREVGRGWRAQDRPVSEPNPHSLAALTLFYINTGVCRHDEASSLSCSPSSCPPHCCACAWERRLPRPCLPSPASSPWAVSDGDFYLYGIKKDGVDLCATKKFVRICVPST
jgi:hypothetical protein